MKKLVQEEQKRKELQYAGNPDTSFGETITKQHSKTHQSLQMVTVNVLMILVRKFHCEVLSRTKTRAKLLYSKTDSTS